MGNRRRFWGFDDEARQLQLNATTDTTRWKLTLSWWAFQSCAKRSTRPGVPNLGFGAAWYRTGSR
jgi:hypothetical protein